VIICYIPQIMNINVNKKLPEVVTSSNSDVISSSARNPVSIDRSEISHKVRDDKAKCAHTKRLIVIAGATASGKTALAAELIRKFPMEIISADSRQVYKGLDIGTGKEKNVPQHMIDVEECKMQNAPSFAKATDGKKCKIKEEDRLYSVAKFRDQALKIIDDVWKRGKIPLVVGGTGFYIDALIYEQTTNVTPPDNKIREKLSKLSNDKLLKILKKTDPEIAQKIDQNNRARLVRAVEIVTITNKPIEKFEYKIRDGWDVQIFVLDIPRKELYQRIDLRVDDRIKEGMIEEVEGLIESGVSVEWLMSLGLEYRWITEFLNPKSEIRNQKYGNSSYKSVISNRALRALSSCRMGLMRDPVGIGTGEILRRAQDDSTRGQDDSLTRDEMTQRLKFAIHAYARRQNTYFKRWPNAKWLSAKDIERTIDKILGGGQ
jgi:tRNA dimethylallyltransferase